MKTHPMFLLLMISIGFNSWAADTDLLTNFCGLYSGTINNETVPIALRVIREAERLVFMFRDHEIKYKDEFLLKNVQPFFQNLVEIKLDDGSTQQRVAFQHKDKCFHAFSDNLKFCQLYQLKFENNKLVSVRLQDHGDGYNEHCWEFQNLEKLIKKDDWEF